MVIDHHYASKITICHFEPSGFHDYSRQREIERVVCQQQKIPNTVLPAYTQCRSARSLSPTTTSGGGNCLFIYCVSGVSGGGATTTTAAEIQSCIVERGWNNVQVSLKPGVGRGGFLYLFSIFETNRSPDHRSVLAEPITDHTIVASLGKQCKFSVAPCSFASECVACVVCPPVDVPA